VEIGGEAPRPAGTPPPRAGVAEVAGSEPVAGMVAESGPVPSHL
jgi:hypothetical protein